MDGTAPPAAADRPSTRAPRRRTLAAVPRAWLPALALCAACATDDLPTRAAPPGVAASAAGPSLRAVRGGPRPTAAPIVGAAGARRGADALPSALAVPAGPAGVVWSHVDAAGVPDGSFGVHFLDRTTPIPDASGGWGPFSVSAGWRVEAAADFDGDGNADLLYHQLAAGGAETTQFGIWLMNGSTPRPGSNAWFGFEASSGWRVVDAFDFDADGSPDLLWRTPAGNAHGIWLMNGPRPRSGAGAWVQLYPSPGWHADAAARFGQGGTPAILWHDPSRDLFGIWRTSGTTLGTGPNDWSQFYASPDWEVVDGTDVDDDGRADLLFRNAVTGAHGIWRLDGDYPRAGSLNLASWTSLPSQGTGWRVAAAAPLLPGARVPMDFGPYTAGQSPNVGSVVSEQQIRDRLLLLRPYSGYVRTYGMTHGLQNIGRIAHELGMRVACGAWLGADQAENDAQIASLIAAGQRGECDVAVVGNETLQRYDGGGGDTVSPFVLGQKLQQVNAALPRITVTTADTWLELQYHPDIVAQLDAVWYHAHPYWFDIREQYAAAWVHAIHGAMVAIAGGRPVVLAESGWPTCGATRGLAVPSAANASAFALDLVSWSRATAASVLLFEAFDEAWKAGEPGGVGPCWGVMTESGQLKPGMAPTFAGATVADHWTTTPLVDGAGTPQISFTSVPPYGSTGVLLRGRVSHVSHVQTRVAVYIRVNGGLWNKPTWAAPTVTVAEDGTWSADITTGGAPDGTATEILAFLVPVAYAVPLVSGAATVPADLTAHALASTSVTRSP